MSLHGSPYVVTVRNRRYPGRLPGPGPQRVAISDEVGHGLQWVRVWNGNDPAMIMTGLPNTVKGNDSSLPNEHVKEFLERLDAALRRKGWSRARLARELGLSRGTVTEWWTVGRSPNGDALLRLPKLLDVSPSELFGNAERGPAADPHPHDTADISEAEEWLSRIANPDMLRRQAGTPTGRDLILGIKSFLFDLDWPLEEKNAVDALLNRIAADAEEKS